MTVEQNHVKLKLQFKLMFALLGVDALMFMMLMAGIVFFKNQMDPAVAALLGGVIGAVTSVLMLGGKDIFNADDNPILNGPVSPGNG